MRTLFMFNMMTLDGFFAGPHQELDWHNVDEEFNEFAIAQLDEIGAILFGRVTYQFMASYWPTELAKNDDPIVAEKMNALPKIVFSRTLETVDWNNSVLIRENIAEEVSKLKQQPGKDLAIFGSGDLVSALANLSLIDEYRVIVNPVLLGNGKPLFKDIGTRLNLKHVRTTTFRSGNVLLCYQPIKTAP